MPVDVFPTRAPAACRLLGVVALLLAATTGCTDRSGSGGETWMLGAFNDGIDGSGDDFVENLVLHDDGTVESIALHCWPGGIEEVVNTGTWDQSDSDRVKIVSDDPEQPFSGFGFEPEIEFEPTDDCNITRVIRRRPDNPSPDVRELIRGKGCLRTLPMPDDPMVTEWDACRSEYCDDPPARCE